MLDPSAFSTPLARAERRKLRDFLRPSRGTMSYQQTVGLFAALATAPTMIPPSVWLEKVRGDYEFRSEQAAQNILGLVLRLYNEVTRSIRLEPESLLPPEEDDDGIREFSQGYLIGVRMDDIWLEDDRAMYLVFAFGVLAGEVSREELAEDTYVDDVDELLRDVNEKLPDIVAALYEYWEEARRPDSAPAAYAAPSKVGRNDPCPCGSGKKFKKCCGRA